MTTDNNTESAAPDMLALAREKNYVGEIVENRQDLSVDVSPDAQPQNVGELMTSTDAASLPVAERVSPPPELLDRMRELEKSHLNLPSATPMDVDEEAKARRNKYLLMGAGVLVVAIILGTVLGVTLGGGASEQSPVSSTESGSPTPSPTTQYFVALQSLIESVSLDDGASLSDPSSPQHKALTWLSTNANVTDYPDWRKIQRYALAVFYYSTNGDEWDTRTGWLTDNDECTWASFAIDPVCNDETGEYLELVIGANNLIGTVPIELALLSDSLRKCHVFVLNRRVLQQPNKCGT